MGAHVRGGGARVSVCAGEARNHGGFSMHEEAVSGGVSHGARIARELVSL